MTIINIRAEVEAILARPMTADEDKAYKEMRAMGFANPYDIVDMLREW